MAREEDGDVRLDGALEVTGATDLDSTLNVDGAVTLQSILTLSPGGTQDYQVGDDGADALTLQSQGAGKALDIRLFTQDADGTDNITLQLWAKGKTGATTNRERLLVGYVVTDLAFELQSEADGTGTLRPIILFTEGNANQLRVEADGKIAIGLTSVGASVLGIKAGVSSNDAAVGGVLYVTTTQGANVGAGEDSLAAYTVPAGTLATNGQSLVFEASGSFAANANNKRVCARFGSSGTNLVFDMTAVAINGQDWFLRGTIVRTGAATQKAYATLIRGTVVPYVQTGLNQTLSGAVTLTVFGEGVSNNDILLETFKVWWDDNNT